MSKTILETKRLLLRYQTNNDIEPLVSIWTSPEVTKFIGAPRKKDFLLKEFVKTAENPYAEKYDLWVVVEKVSEEVVGHCGFIDKLVEGNVEIDLTYIFTPSAWGKGYATEIAAALKEFAFGVMGEKRLIALIHPGNEASASVAMKIGMTKRKQLLRPNNEVRDMYVIENSQ